MTDAPLLTRPIITGTLWNLGVTGFRGAGPRGIAAARALAGPPCPGASDTGRGRRCEMSWSRSARRSSGTFAT